MPKKIYCSLDIEGTGLDPKKDAITEVGAVLFEIGKNGEIKFGEEFSSLVKPAIVIPDFIVGLTGISNDMVKDAPAWEETLPKFKKFVGRHIILGQNIQFDLNFLVSAGLPFEQGSIDTRSLASMFLPTLRFYNLEYLMRYFQVPLVSHHRALDDSKSTALLLGQIVKHFQTLPPATQKSVAKILKASGLLYHPLFQASAVAKAKQNLVIEPNSQASTPVQAELFAPKSVSTKSLSFQPLFSSKGFSFAEFLPSSFTKDNLAELCRQANEFSGSILVSVASKEDLALVRDDCVDWVILDEPQHYLCQQRLSALLAHTKPSPALAQFLAKLLVWQSIKSKTDISDLPLYGEEYAFRDLVCGDYSLCLKHEAGQDCELQRVAVLALPEAKILTTHKAWSRFSQVQPEKHFPLAIFWNAGELARVFADLVSAWLNLRSLRGVVTCLYDPASGAGVLENLSAETKKVFSKTLDALDLHFGILSIELAKQSGRSPVRVVDASFRESESFNVTHESGEKIISDLTGLLSAVAELAKQAEQKWLVQKLETALTFLQEFFVSPKDSQIYWFEFFSQQLKFKTQSRTLPIKQLGNFEAVVMADCLAPKGLKEYYAKIFGVTDFTTAKFHGALQPLSIFLPTHFPAKDSPQAHGLNVKLLEALLPKLSGRTVILSHSQESLDHLYRSLNKKNVQPHLLVQKYTGHHWKNFENFKADPRSVWLLTQTNYLRNIRELPETQNLILMKIPYDTPGIFSSLYDSDTIFEEQILPKTVIRLQQIFCRGFISTKENSKSAAVKKIIFLDPRMAEHYNEQLLSCLSENFKSTVLEFTPETYKQILD